METADIVLAFVSVISGITGILVKSIMRDIKDLEHSMNHCQSNMPKDYVLMTTYKDDQKEFKSDIKSDIAEIKHLIGKLFDKVEGRKQ